MADSNDKKQDQHLNEHEAPSSTTLLPMLAGGLVLIVIGMVVVMAVA